MSVRLSQKVLNHIVTRHPEVVRYIDKIVEAVQDPDIIFRGLRGELKALKFYADTPVGPKYLVVIYREQDGEKVIITAYFTSKVDRVKGEMIWRKLQ